MDPRWHRRLRLGALLILAALAAWPAQPQEETDAGFAKLDERGPLAVSHQPSE
jgi:hypothetical protein